jgi:hypothetical protein
MRIGSSWGQISNFHSCAEELKIRDLTPMEIRDLTQRNLRAELGRTG